MDEQTALSLLRWRCHLCHSHSGRGLPKSAASWEMGTAWVMEAEALGCKCPPKRRVLPGSHPDWK